MTVTEVYPRGCGEHFFGVHSMKELLGLSPLAWGTRIPAQRLRYCARFIPARAGNTQKSESCTVCHSVYPRSRGEHPPLDQSAQIRSGLSPLARGTLKLPPSQNHSIRFIPARAGNTSFQIPSFISGTVYPRSRGEHLLLLEILE